tara:strand:+ start:729 stop:1448 length:720 start_codon:yes stop_codon:yes gene_type:complete
MKKFIYIIFCFCFSTIRAQVGIGTTTPKSSAILDITSTEKGVLVPRMDENDRNNITSPEKSLLIFNTTSNSFEYNSGNNSSKSWTSIKSYGNSPSVKYSSVASTDNINTATATNIKLFNSLNWNDNSSLYSKVDLREIEITEPGRYQVICNLYIKGTSTGSTRIRTGNEIYLAINNIQFGINSATSYIRQASSHNTASLHINETFEIDSSKIISIQSIRKANSGNVEIVSANIVIKKIR